jgi:hypothetical protein
VSQLDAVCVAGNTPLTGILFKVLFKKKLLSKGGGKPATLKVHKNENFLTPILNFEFGSARQKVLVLNIFSPNGRKMGDHSNY